MHKVNQNPFSPFYKVKKVLWGLRWFLGFPFKPSNAAFNQFSFNPWLEYARYTLYIFIPCLCLGYANYLCMKAQNNGNPFTAMHAIFNRIGLSTLDMVVIFSVGVFNLLSNSLYLNSFRKGLAGINKISRYLTLVNEKLYGIRRGLNLTTHQPKCRQAYVFLALVCAIPAFASGMLAVFWYHALLNETPAQDISKWEKVAFCFANPIFNIFLMYPPMAVSADFIVCHLLKETKGAFDHFTQMMKPRNESHVKANGNQISHLSEQDLKSNHNSIR